MLMMQLGSNLAAQTRAVCPYSTSKQSDSSALREARCMNIKHLRGFQLNEVSDLNWPLHFLPLWRYGPNPDRSIIRCWHKPRIIFIELDRTYHSLTNNTVQCYGDKNKSTSLVNLNSLHSTNLVAIKGNPNWLRIMAASPHTPQQYLIKYSARGYHQLSKILPSNNCRVS